MVAGLIIMLVVFGAVAGYFIAIYNGIVTLKNRVENGWAQIDTQLQRRFDLIPNLVETVKGYAKHESEVFDRITTARSNTLNAKSITDKAAADTEMSGALKSLFAVAEAYPVLQASANFKELQVELTNTENRIAFSRQFYNDSVARLNTAKQKFPHSMIADRMHIETYPYYEVDSAEVRATPKISF